MVFFSILYIAYSRQKTIIAEKEEQWRTFYIAEIVHYAFMNQL